MKLIEFARRLQAELEALDHPEIVSVEDISVPPGSSDDPNAQHRKHNLVKVNYANGGSTTIMVQAVRGPGIPKHANYDLPREAF
ncbi:hypothetical protein LX15_002583 [Streptoalloteichus tenebrarius]|uniref:Transposase n=1 Tax=Streptoalloteichus tenebrarius (strain ATCC 17920 / DSM 40477 / JCM 4838 / CBS 697.72 / NBRC 16177 / NCIMB 11028 / NRRL B-12390 / A12253. 1 / ISP 5477) TaxID=1933 RepID=A0ABT1HTM9_STRSD|nr:hypothetical protein [Streptoalloteichus tenebrarius]MCP2258885.1 hypothetical protein [Streptoalloteichus tenebrarius]BFE99430.1 hypothetical protein GCM10020241_11060 [Streptoalloteichus tenebrarius]